MKLCMILSPNYSTLKQKRPSMKKNRTEIKKQIKAQELLFQKL